MLGQEFGHEPVCHDHYFRNQHPSGTFPVHSVYGNFIILIDPYINIRQRDLNGSCSHPVLTELFCDITEYNNFLAVLSNYINIVISELALYPDQARNYFIVDDFAGFA